MGVVMLLEIPFDTRENWTGQQAPFFPSRNLDSTPSGHGLSQRINLFFSFFLPIGAMGPCYLPAFHFV